MDLHPELDAWLRAGRSDPEPRHLAACAQCRAALAETERVRGWFPDPGEVISEASAETIRFRLEGEARGRTHGPQQRRAHRSRAWVGIGATAVVLAAAAMTASELRRSSEVVPSAPRIAPATPDAHRTSTAPSAPPEVTLDLARPNPPPPALRPTSSPSPRIARAAQPVEPPAEAPPSPPTLARFDLDRAFGEAWRLRREGRADAAALAFDALLDHDTGSRRADILFWSARAHLDAGHDDVTEARLRALLRDHPESWHAPEARSMLAAAGSRRTGQ